MLKSSRSPARMSTGGKLRRSPPPKRPPPVYVGRHKEYRVLEILDHGYYINRNGKQRVKALVQWVGYEKATWEPWANIYRTQAARDYQDFHQIRIDNQGRGIVGLYTDGVEVEDG